MVKYFVGSTEPRMLKIVTREKSYASTKIFCLEKVEIYSLIIDKLSTNYLSKLQYTLHLPV